MEYINKIELRGIVGTATLNRVGDSQVCRFSIATDYSYKDRDGNPVVETTWFNVTAWEGKDIQNLEAITRGAIVHIIGRLKCNRYVDANGNDRVQYEIVARKLEVMKEDRV